MYVSNWLFFATYCCFNPRLHRHEIAFVLLLEIANTARSLRIEGTIKGTLTIFLTCVNANKPQAPSWCHVRHIYDELSLSAVTSVTSYYRESNNSIKTCENL